MADIKNLRHIKCLRSYTIEQLDQLLRQLERNFVNEGGITERMYKARKEFERKNKP